MITRFYDGDSDNNVHCWDDGQAGNPDSDPAWRGDFKGLIEKLDYIKALGFTALRLNSVAQNASGYDYYGEHPVNLKKIDVRYESDGYTYEDLVDACHERGLKVIQNVMLNSTSNFGEEFLGKMFDINEKADFSNLQEMLVPTDKLLNTYGLSSVDEYWAQSASIQYSQRLNLLKNTTYTGENSNTIGSYPDESDYEKNKVSESDAYNPNNYYHTGYFQSLNWDDWTGKYCQIAGDKVDINTENYAVGQYLAETCKMYADYGVDAIYIKDARHITRLSLNLNIIDPLKEMLKAEGKDIDIFAEVVTRYSQPWYRDHATESTQFYTWDDDDKWEEKWSNGVDAESVNNNMNVTFDFITENDDTTKQPESNNAFLNGIEYHTPDYSKSSGVNVFDFTMHRNFGIAANAFSAAQNADKYYNDSTWNMTGVETEDYSPELLDEKVRYSGGTDAWLENLSLLFTFRGIPSIIQGTEVEFQKEAVIDMGPNLPLADTGRAYYGDYLEGDVKATDFGEYTANGEAVNTLNSDISKHLRTLNRVRQQVPALRKGQYTTSSYYVSGNMAFIRRYKDNYVDSLALVTITDEATFKGIPNGKYIDAVSGEEQVVTNGSLTVTAPGKGNLAVYVCCADGFTSVDANIEVDEYKAEFDANGGEGAMEAVESCYGVITLPECTFTAPSGKSFKAWSIDGIEYDAGDKIKVISDITAKALWQDIIFELTTDSVEVSGLSKGESLVVASYSGDELINVKMFTLSGYFKKALIETGLNLANADKIKAFLWKDMTPLCESESISVTPITVSFDADGGEGTMEPVTVLAKANYTLPKCAFTAPEGKEFKAWSINGDEYNPGEAVSLSADTTITAVWEEAKIYFKNTEGWAKVNAYYWSPSNIGMTTWPGKAMTRMGETDIWYIEVPEEAESIIFNNGSDQTGDLTIPTDGNNLYTYSTGGWSEY